MATKSDRISTSPLIASSVYNITDMDSLPLIRRRRAASGPLKSFLLGAATLLVVLLTAIVVYLVISLCLVQRQLTSVSQELTYASNRLDRVEKKLLHEHKENRTLPTEGSNESESTTATSLLRMLQRLPSERHNKKQHRVSKREASNPASRASDDNRKLHKGEPRSRRSSNSGGNKSKRDSRDRQMSLVLKEVKEIRNEMDSLRNEVAHPSALMVLPDDQQTSNEDYYTSSDDNAIQWMVEHNSLFDTTDSTYLVVKTAGTYFIYLQITYNGQRKTVNPTCSHMVMLQNPNYVARHRPILYGSSTQHRLGKVIRFPESGGEVRAIDTVHQSGVFQLTVGDRIYVKPDEQSHDCIVSPLKDKTFFGAFRLQSSFHEYA